MSLVYSTETGRMCPNCRLAVAQCLCKQRAAAQLPGDGAGAGPVRVSRESKGRGGKTVTLVRGLPLAAQTLAQLGKQLRTACGTGGTAKDGVLELQGDHVEKTLAWLQQQGHAAKRSGG
jgi:translation initiation factor 1